MSETANTVKTHDVAHIPESWFWSAHSVALAAVIVGVAIIAFARGPRRIDALRSFQADQDKAKEKTATNKKTEAQ
jgi:hypothetical protein